MPLRLRLEAHRSIEVSQAKLSSRIGCGLMLAGLPRFENSDALMNILGNYGYTAAFADKPAQRILANTALLKAFYDNCFLNKTPFRQNFRNTFGHLEIYLAFDPQSKRVWFVADQHNRIALANYYQHAVSITLKAIGVLLLGSLMRLTPVGWQNLSDLLSDDFLQAHRNIERVEVMSVMSGVRWREPCLGIGVTLLNLKEASEIKTTVEAALRGETGSEIHD